MTELKPVSIVSIELPRVFVDMEHDIEYTEAEDYQACIYQCKHCLSLFGVDMSTLEHVDKVWECPTCHEQYALDFRPVESTVRHWPDGCQPQRDVYKW